MSALREIIEHNYQKQNIDRLTEEDLFYLIKRCDNEFLAFKLAKMFVEQYQRNFD